RPSSGCCDLPPGVDRPAWLDRPRSALRLLTPMPACSPHLRRALCLLWLFVLAGCGGGGGGSAVPGAAAGSVVVAGYTAVDSDLNEPAAPVKANASLAQAQAVAAPATIGGYLTRPGAGPAGRSRDTGDPQDVFQVELAAGQQAILHAAPLS